MLWSASNEAGEPIVDYLDASDDVFFIVSGEVRVTIYSVAGKAVSFRELGPGDTFGEFPAIDGGPRSAGVEARTSCLLASMPALAVNNRIQAEILRLASLAPKDGKSARIAPAPTHGEIASRVSTHREAVTRELNRLARIGLIERKGGALVVKDIDRLA
jgi:CRP-like cAMP-binding protein